MEYQQIPSTYKDDLIAEALYAREIEHFHYCFDRDNFIEILKNTPPGLDYDNLLNRLNETIYQIENVERYAKALLKQIRSIELHNAAIDRTTKKRGEIK